MTQDEVIKLAKKAGFGNYAYEAAGIFERFAAMVAAAEREKCTGTQEFVTLPREVVEHAMEALEHAEKDCADFQRVNTDQIFDAATALRAALDQPQNHVPDAGNMVPAGWKLVPVEPTREMIEAGKDAHYEAEKRIQEPGAWERGGFAKRAVRAAHVFQVMLDAAPKPPTVKYSLTVEQPQANQPAMTPIAQRKLDSLLEEGYTISGYSIYHEQKHQHGFVTGAGLVGWWRPEGMEYPQPKREPLTDEEIDKLCPQFDDPMRREMWIIGFKAAHNIK